MSNSEVKILVDQETGQRYRFAAIDGADLQPEPTPTPAPAQPTPAPAKKKSKRGKPTGKKNETPESKAARIAAWEADQEMPDAIIKLEDGTTKPHSEIQAEKEKAGGFKRRGGKKRDWSNSKHTPLCQAKGTCFYVGTKKMEYAVWRGGQNEDGTMWCYLRPIDKTETGDFVVGTSFPVNKKNGGLEKIVKGSVTTAPGYLESRCGCPECVAMRKRQAA